MKTQPFSNHPQASLNTSKLARLLSCLVLLLIGTFTGVGELSAQTENIWLGNTYGDVGNWHAPENWSRGHVPHDMETAVIPDLTNKGKAFYPEVRFEAEVGRLHLAPQARLTVREGSILLIGQVEEADTAGLEQIYNQGELVLQPEVISSTLLERLALGGKVQVTGKH